MLSPQHPPVSLAYISAGKLSTAHQLRHFSDTDFFKPISAGNGLSCTYSAEFYEAFSQNSSSSHHSEIAMLVLEYMTVQDKARLPLFTNASERYVKQVMPAIQELLATEAGDDETLATKTHIINCASRLNYLTRSSVIFQGIVRLDRVSLVGMDLRDCYLPMARLSEADLSGADLRKINLRVADLRMAELGGANLSKADLNRADVSLAYLRGADFSEADLSEAEFINANLGWANLSGANLRGTNLYGADLSHANLRKADLFKVNLRNAKLVDADLRGANLRKTDLRWADLRGTDLRETDLSSADLSGAIGYIPKT